MYEGHEGIQLTQMGCVRNSNPGTNRHEALCVLSVLQGHQCEEGGGLGDPNQNRSPVGLQNRCCCATTLKLPATSFR